MSHQQHQQEEENILLPTAPNGAPNESFRRLWNYSTKISSDQISKILRRMNHEQLFRFFEFMHHTCLHDPSIQYSQRQLEHYQTILMCCPRLILAEYLCSIDEQCRINILQHCDVIWTMYFVGLIELGYDTEVYMELRDLIRIYGNDFAFSLVLFLAQEISNQGLQLDLRERIYQFICRNPQMVLMIVQRENEEEPASFEQLFDQMNQWSQNVSQRNGFNHLHQWMIDDFRFVQEPEPERELESEPEQELESEPERELEPEPQPQHHAVDAEAFVRATFPSLHPLCRECVYQCGICHSGPDEPNEDDSMKVFRSMPCCPQMCCHDCLVRQAIVCNTPDREFKDTSVFICPFARHETDFFLPNQEFEENYKIEMTEQNNQEDFF
jgi:hypothetical protein